MNIYSSFSNSKVNISVLICAFIGFILTGCYSFTGGGGLPDYIKSINISPAIDNSGFGDPQYRDYLTVQLVQKFRDDGSLKIVLRGGDSELKPILSSINEQVVAVRPGEVEKERKVTATISIEFYDAVKKKTIWSKSFSNYETYQIAQAPAARESAIKSAIKKACDDALLAVISNW